MKFRSDIKVELIAHMVKTRDGTPTDDEWMAENAWVSSQLGPEEPNPKHVKGLVNTLIKKRHGTPIEGGTSLQFYVEAPIFVFREWHRHRIAWGFSEMSARYLDEYPPEFWVPSVDRPVKKVTGSKMAPTFEPLPEGNHANGVESMKAAYKTCYTSYLLLQDMGFANEVARAVLPVGIYSRMRATCNVRSLMHFLSLRTHEPEAMFPSYPQLEIEEAAREMEKVLAEHYPIAYKAFCDNGRIAP